MASRATLRAAVLQLNTTEDADRNLSAALELVDEAAALGARLLVLPEKFHYLGDPVGVARVRQGLEGPVLTELAAAAGRHGVFIVCGSIWEDLPGEERAANTSVLMGPDGRRLAVYRKIHMFDVEVGGQVYSESDECRPGHEVVAVRLPAGALSGTSPAGAGPSGPAGTGLAPFEHAGLVVGMSVCYDVRFPELYRALADLGAHVVTVPAAFTMATGRDHWQVLLRARAIENQVFVVAANQTGRHDATHESYGRSMIVDPWGVVLAQAADGRGIAVADLDLHALGHVRRRLPALQHRAPEAYLRKTLIDLTRGD